MHRPIPRAPGLPFGGGLNLLLVAGAAYFAWEHEQGRHGRPHALCLCVPKTLSTSCDQAIFVDQATDASLPSDAVVLKVDRFGSRFQRRGCVQGAVRAVL